MTDNVFPLRDESISDTACLWISMLDRGLTPNELTELSVWLNASPEHTRAFLELAECWDKSESLALLAEVVPHALHQSNNKAPRVNRHRWGWGGAAAACVFVTVMMISTQWWVAPTPSPTETLTYETAVGGLSRTSLLDGSVLTLNTNTQVEVTLTRDKRLLVLRSGEMHIDVAEDPNRPLQVIANGALFEAVGTQFNVRIDESKHVELLVTEGKVRVGIRPKSLNSLDAEERSTFQQTDIYLEQGERVTLDGDKRIVENLVPSEIDVELSWQDGNLVFRGESLSEAIAEISRYTPVEFVIFDEDLKTLRIAGLFKSGDVSGFLESLEANFDIRYERSGNRTFIRAPE